MAFRYVVLNLMLNEPFPNSNSESVQHKAVLHSRELHKYVL